MKALPFPFERLEKATRADARLGQRVSRLATVADPDRAASVLRHLLQLDTSLRWGTPRSGPAAGDEAASGDIALRLRSGTRRGCVLLTCARGVAQALVDRMLGGPWPTALTGSAGHLDAFDQGVLVYLAARVLGVLPGTCQVIDCQTDPEAIQRWTADDPGMVRVPLQLALGDRSLPLACWMPRTLLPATTTGRGAPAVRLLDLALDAYACAGGGVVPLRDLRALGADDIVVLDWCTLSPSAEGVRGAAELRLSGHRVDGLTLRCQDGALTAVLETKMTDETPTRTSLGHPGQSEAATERGLEMAGDAPVPVELELARFSLTLRHLAALAPGDVLATGTPIGELVSLRVGDQVIARGELLDVEGELGVRVTELVGPRDPGI